MPPRVDSDDVKGVIDTDLADLTPFISTAHIVVEEELKPKGLTEARLTEVEKWLSAHLAALFERDDEDLELGPMKLRTRRRFDGSSLERTQWGQQVILLDTTDTLVNIGKQRARIKSFGFSNP